MRRYFFLFLLILAGCNLETPGVATVEPTATPYVAPTPYRPPTQVGATPVQGAGAQAVVATPTRGNLLTPIPAQTLIAQPQPPPEQQNAVEAVVNNVLVPIWNFLYTFVIEGAGTLWLFAGARGGAFAQVFCCVAPAIVVVGVALLRFRRWRRR